MCGGGRAPSVWRAWGQHCWSFRLPEQARARRRASARRPAARRGTAAASCRRSARTAGTSRSTRTRRTSSHGDTNGARDVFVRDLQTGETTRVSVSSSGAEANGDSFAPALSSDGRYVAFSSAATNLVDGDTNDANDIFIRDRQANTTTRVSVGFDGSQANGGSDQPSLSGDGRLVAFTSTASNIVNGDANNLRDAFVYDRQAGTAVNVSVDSNGVQGDLESASPVLSADGKFVAYQSFADNLIPDDQNEGGDIFVRDLQANTTERVSEYTGHYEAEGDSQRPSISADGRYVAFDSDDWDLVWGDTNDSFDVFVNDRATTVTTRVSVDDSGTQSNSDSFRPSISADGRYVAFYSEASNLVPGDTNGATDVFVYDRRSGATKRVSVAAGGRGGERRQRATGASAETGTSRLSSRTPRTSFPATRTASRTSSCATRSVAAARAAGQVPRPARDRDAPRGRAQEDRQRELQHRQRAPGALGEDPRRQGALPEPEGRGGAHARDEGQPRRRPALSATCPGSFPARSRSSSGRDRAGVLRRRPRSSP